MYDDWQTINVLQSKYVKYDGYDVMVGNAKNWSAYVHTQASVNVCCKHQIKNHKLIKALKLMLCLEVWRERRVKGNDYPLPYLDAFKIE